MDEEEFKKLQDELKQKHAAREAAAKPARRARDAQDMIAVNDCKEKHGNDGVRVLDLPCLPPLPGVLVIKPPTPSDYDLWQTILMKNNATNTEKKAAHQEFAESVLLYPDVDMFRKMLAGGFAGLVVTVTAEAAKLAGVGLEARGKE